MMAGLRLMFSKMIGLTVLKMILKENSLWPITASIKTLNGILKKRKRGLFRKGDEVISFEKDLEGYWEYLSQKK
jgi:hypothetical protein